MSKYWESFAWCYSKNEICTIRVMMEYFFSSVILSAFIITVLANSSAKLEKSGDERKTQSDMINNYYGAHCKRVELHLAEMKQEIKALREKLTGSPGRKGV